VPASDWLRVRASNGEPRNAMMVTGTIIFLSLLVRDLNAVAPLITMFFLVTYAMINAAVLIEQSLDLVSFRPRLRIPMWVSMTGLGGSLLAMFIINPTVSFVAIAVTLGFYAVLARRRLDAPFEDVRSGLFVALAEWAAKKVTDLPTMQERAWKPNLLVPVENASDLRGTFLILQDIAHPQGSVSILGLHPPPSSPAEDDRRPGGNGNDARDQARDRTRDRSGHAGPGGEGGGADDAYDEEAERAAATGPPLGTPDPNGLDEQLTTLTSAFRDRGVFASSTVVDAGTYAESVCASMQTLRGAFFRPNVVFLRMPTTPAQEDAYRTILREAEREQVGVLLYAPHARAALGQRQTINVWIRDRSPDWRISMQIGNLDLALLTAYKLALNWDATMRLITVVDDPDEQPKAQDFLEKIIDVGRFPNAAAIAHAGAFHDYVVKAPPADLSLFGLLSDPDFDFPRRMVETTRSSCLFVRDSGRESAMA
jgi:hypothetical protein